MIISPEENCEHGNKVSGDGCSSTCNEEPGWKCNGSPPQTCNTVCGDGI